jgi:hypothetical protein
MTFSKTKFREHLSFYKRLQRLWNNNGALIFFLNSMNVEILYSNKAFDCGMFSL